MIGAYGHSRLREFVFGALAAPTLFTLLWMTVFGNSAIDIILGQGVEELGAAVREDESVALFKFLEQFPMASFLSGLATIMVLVFFVTSADSGAMVLNMLSSNGRDDTPLWRRIFWMAMIGVTAMVLLVAGGLSSLQTAAIASALPFSVAILLAIWGFVRALSVDHAKRQALVLANPGPLAADWQERLRNLLSYPGRSEVSRFISMVAQPAMREFADELRQHGMDVRVDQPSDEDRVTLSVMHGNEIDFQYMVVGREHPRPDAALTGASGAEQETYHRAEVHLNEGSQDYDVMGWTKQQVMQDLLDQYEKHLHFLHVLR